MSEPIRVIPLDPNEFCTVKIEHYMELVKAETHLELILSFDENESFYTDKIMKAIRRIREEREDG